MRFPKETILYYIFGVNTVEFCHSMSCFVTIYAQNNQVVLMPIELCLNCNPTAESMKN